MAVTRSAARVSSSTATKAHSAARAERSPSKAKPIPPKTEDGHFIVVKNRRWRATDPLIPADALKELKHYLALGRSGVRGKKSEPLVGKVALARKMTGLAKLGLGERGKPVWWDESDEGRKKRWEECLEKLRALKEEDTVREDGCAEIKQHGRQAFPQ